MLRGASAFGAKFATVSQQREGSMKSAKLIGVFLVWSGLVLGASHGGMSGHARPGVHPSMGSVANGHHFHGFPRGMGGVYVNPYAYWNGYGYSYGTGSVYGYGNSFGAVSYSPSTGIYGWATGFAALYNAQNQAALNCSASATDCRNLMWFANTCAALSISATNKSAVGWAWNTHAATAQYNAQFECGRYANDCIDQGSVCSY
jgi:hypothetical protein